jgi:hypothetical protein
MGGPTAMESGWKNLGTGPGDDVVSSLSDEVISIHPSRKQNEHLKNADGNLL